MRPNADQTPDLTSCNTSILHTFRTLIILDATLTLPDENAIAVSADHEAIEIPKTSAQADRA